MEESTPRELTIHNAREAFEAAAARAVPAQAFEGRGILITAGGPFVPSAYVAVRMLRRLGVTLPIEVWHAGADEIPNWGRRAFEACQVSLHDVMPFCPGRPLSEMRGWPIKPAALGASRLREVLFLDADCFPLRNPEFLFETPQYREHRAVFFPDSRFHRLIAGASIWDLTGVAFRGDAEFETGIFLVDKTSRWRELCLVQWLNAHSTFWYEHVLGDKDTFYLAWRKLGTSYCLAPPCIRYRSIATRHVWKDGDPIADHRTGTSKYSLPERKGPFTTYLTPYAGRSALKNIYDEAMQRFFVRNFSLHMRLLRELASLRAEA